MFTLLINFFFFIFLLSDLQKEDKKRREKTLQKIGRKILNPFIPNEMERRKEKVTMTNPVPSFLSFSASSPFLSPLSLSLSHPLSLLSFFTFFFLFRQLSTIGIVVTVTTDDDDNDELFLLM